jgi:hypothetical protein
MKKLSDQLGVLDAHGTRHLKTSNAGCPHCGTTDIKYSSDGKFALHHPGAECCIPRLEQQITWRKHELANITNKLDVDVKNLNATATATTNIHEATNTLERNSRIAGDHIQADLTDLTRKLRDLKGHA